MAPHDLVDDASGGERTIGPSEWVDGVDATTE